MKRTRKTKRPVYCVDVAKPFDVMADGVRLCRGARAVRWSVSQGGEGYSIITDELGWMWRPSRNTPTSGTIDFRKGPPKPRKPKAKISRKRKRGRK